MIDPRAVVDARSGLSATKSVTICRASVRSSGFPETTSDSIHFSEWNHRRQVGSWNGSVDQLMSPVRLMGTEA